MLIIVITLLVAGSVYLVDEKIINRQKRRSSRLDRWKKYSYL